jgi:hypothetical protein
MSTVTDRVTDLFTLNRAEKRLVSAAQQDTVADLGAQEDGDRPVIRAELLRELCHWRPSVERQGPYPHDRRAGPGTP